jgi:tetratricopeptide (TPR) repeat protein
MDGGSVSGADPGERQSAAASTHPLAYVRRRHGWSYQDLARVIADNARILGVPMAARREKVWRWEHWGVVPEADSQRALARALGIPPRELELRPWPRWLPAHGGMPDGLPWTTEGSLTALTALLDNGAGDPRGFPIADEQALLDAIADWDAAGAEGAGVGTGAGAAVGTGGGGTVSTGAGAAVGTGAGAAVGTGASAAVGTGAGAAVGRKPGTGPAAAAARGSASAARSERWDETASGTRSPRVPRQAVVATAAPDNAVDAAVAAAVVDGPVVEWLEAGVLGLRRLDDRLGGAAVRHRAEADLRMVRGLLHRGQHERAHGTRLLRVAADLAQLGGWAATDTGRHGAAQRHYLTGLRLAHSAGDRSLAVALWGGLALHAVIAGQPRDAVAAAEAGVRAAGGAPASVRALAASRLSRAHAAIGADGPSRRAVAEAERQLDLAERESGPPWLYWFDTAELAAQTGQALLDLGHAHEARPLLEQALAMQDASYVRDRCLYSARAATARALTGDLEGARTLGREAARLSRHCGSPRIADTLDALKVRLDAAR